MQISKLIGCFLYFAGILKIAYEYHLYEGKVIKLIILVKLAWKKSDAYTLYYFRVIFNSINMMAN